MTPVLNVADVVTPETFRLVADALPNIGVTNVGLVANTLAPVPVSSVSAVKSCSDVKDPNDVAVLTDVIAPVRLGILVVEVAVPLTAPLNDVAVMIPAVTFASVVIPVTFKSVKVLGAFAIAVSIVVVVVASNEAMFLNCLAALMTSVLPILTDVTDVIPAFTIFLLSSMIVLFEILIATVFVYTRGYCYLVNAWSCALVSLFG
jgi:hypothetical protein